MGDRTPALLFVGFFWCVLAGINNDQNTMREKREPPET